MSDDETKNNNKQASMESIYAMAVVGDMEEVLEEIADKLNLSKRTVVGLAISRMYFEVMKDSESAGLFTKYGYLIENMDGKDGNQKVS